MNIQAKKQINTQAHDGRMRFKVITKLGFKLSPCPFCKSEIINIVGLRTRPYVQCDVCLSSTGTEGTLTEAINLWNGELDKDEGEKE